MHRALRAGLRIHAALLALLVGVGAAFAADVNGIPLCTAASDQTLPVSVSDGAGGVIVAWHDSRPTAAVGGVVYAQRLNAAGVPQWAPDGVALFTTGDPGNPGNPVIAPDGSGGAFVATGGVSAAPRVQRVNASGAPLWGPDGVAVTTDSPRMRDVAIARDIGGTGGAFVAWRLDNGAGGTADVYAQKVNSAGALQWPSQGVPIAATNMNSEGNPAILSDGGGGAFFVWIGGAGVRIQRYDGAGSPLWNNVVLSATGNNMPPAIVSDGSGGVITAWAGGGAFVQRVTSAGNRLWSPLNGGVTLSTTGRAPTLIGDGAGGAIVTWEDNRVTLNFNIYAQRLNASGTPQWMVDGSPVCMAPGDQRSPVIVSDGAGSGLVSWDDARTTPASGTDIYAQRINAVGTAQWTADGVALCTAPNDQKVPTMVSDGVGGAWVAWQDLRGGTTNDVYAARVSPNGTTLSVPSSPGPSLASAWPNPFSGRVAMGFVMPVAGKLRARVVDLQGRQVADLGVENLAAGPQQIIWDGQADDGRMAEAGIYFIRVEGPGVAASRSVVRLK